MISYGFHNPEWLWLLLALPLIAWLKGRIGPDAAIRFSSTAIAREVSKNKKTRAGTWLFMLRLFALTALIIALARPQIGEGHTETDASGIDIVLAVDVSSSMLAFDFTQDETHLITRLDAVREVIQAFIKKRPNDRIGLVAFARYPYLVSPLTLNHEWLEKNVERLQTGIGEDGTAIGSAIGMSVNRLRDLPSKSRVIILLTDGVNNSGKISPIAAAEAATAFNTKIYTIAAGHGGIVPFPRLNSDGKIIQTPWGQPALMRVNIPIDEEVLQEIADMTGGAFYRARDIKQLEAIYNEIDALEKTEVTIRQYASYTELFEIPALIALILVLLEHGLRQLYYRRLP
ncbi:MAG TPA: hypothetical protein DIU37_02415 [Opitutae bacterium]|nr:hypothetical protein [Opitutae bacterium]|tara:strand:- start:391 stop:1422 length:1032 start_codon:yes stop_codon:yes gene_type:complete